MAIASLHDELALRANTKPAVRCIALKYHDPTLPCQRDGSLRANRAQLRGTGDLRVRAPARQSPDCLRGAVLRNSPRSQSLRAAVGREASRAWHFRTLVSPLRPRAAGPAPRSVPPASAIVNPRRLASSPAFAACAARSWLLAMLAPCRVRREPVRPVSLRQPRLALRSVSLYAASQYSATCPPPHRNRLPAKSPAE